MPKLDSTREGVAGETSCSTEASRTENLGFRWLLAAAGPRCALLLCNRLDARAVVLAGILRLRRALTSAITCRLTAGAYVDLLNGSNLTAPTSALP